MLATSPEQQRKADGQENDIVEKTSKCTIEKVTESAEEIIEKVTESDEEIIEKVTESDEEIIKQVTESDEEIIAEQIDKVTESDEEVLSETSSTQTKTNFNESSSEQITDSYLADESTSNAYIDYADEDESASNTNTDYVDESSSNFNTDNADESSSNINTNAEISDLTSDLDTGDDNFSDRTSPSKSLPDSLNRSLTESDVELESRDIDQNHNLTFESIALSESLALQESSSLSNTSFSSPKSVSSKSESSGSQENSIEQYVEFSSNEIEEAKEAVTQLTEPVPIIPDLVEEPQQHSASPIREVLLTLQKEAAKYRNIQETCNDALEELASNQKEVLTVRSYCYLPLKLAYDTKLPRFCILAVSGFRHLLSDPLLRATSLNPNKV